MTSISFDPDWRSAWRWFSVQALAIGAALTVAWDSLPADVKADLPSHTYTVLMLVVAALGILGRLVKQEPAA